MKTRRRIVVMGIVGRSPVAGVAWQALHYLEGLRRLGHDVWYVEDTGVWPYDGARDTVTDDPAWTIAYVSRLMRWVDLDHRWAYVSGVDGQTFGMTESELADALSGADALLNVTGSTILRDEHMRVPVRAYIETDPVLPEIEVANGVQATIDTLDAHTHLFTFGENVGQPDCPVPVGRFEYLPTRQPVVLDWWSPSTASVVRGYSTITSWEQSGKDAVWQGETYRWSKHLEFLKFIDLPRLADAPFELALSSRDTAVVTMLEEYGWKVADAGAISSSHEAYRRYIWSSAAEFTVAKDQYVRLQTGWFSDRSACYLAAGKPVITQETGFSGLMPTGAGLFGFDTMTDILAALETIARDPDAASTSARDAATCFEAESVLSSMLQRTGL